MDVLIVDDERLARKRMEDLIADEEVDLLGSIGDAEFAVEVIRDRNPELVFLDVQMPEMTGLEVIRRVGVHEMPIVVFVTAYDQYAVDAFELSALDYLLKPYQDARFYQALERARKMHEQREIEEFRNRVAQLLADEAPEPRSSSRETEYLRRIPVQGSGEIKVVSVEDVDFFTASGSYVEIYAGEETYLARKSLRELEESLDPREFFRIHRSHIVRLDRIDALLIRSGGDYGIRLENGKKLDLSRARRDELEQRLGM